MPLSPRTLRPASSGFNPRQISGLALWLDGADASSLYTTDAGPVSAVSSPTEISGCALWLDGADSSSASMTLNGSLVETWKDKSNSGNDVTASGGLRPTLTSNALNSRSVLTFGGSQGLTGNLAASITTNAYSVFVVCKITGAITNGRLLSTGGAGNDFASGSVIPCVSNGGTLSAYAGTQGTTTSGVTGFASYGVFAGVLSSNLVTNSAGGMSAASAAATLSTAVTRLGVGVAAQGGTGFNTCDIAEIILYPTALSTADRARVEAYLAAKWGISGVHAQATATSDPVGHWGDKSGNARHAMQTTAANRPTVSTTTLNGRRTLGFDGSDDRLDIAALDTTPATVFSVVRHNSGTTTAARTPYAFSDGASYIHAQFIQSGASQMVGLTHNAARASFTADKIDVLGVPFLLTSSQSSGGGGLVGRVNGSGLPFTAGIQDAGGANRVGCRFRNSANDQFWNGQIAELLVYQSDLTDAQIARVERYLASRWGITLAPQVSNADAQDWINRVYANGGTVSASTAAAVNQFCVDIEAASIRDRFFRLNLFCGTGLNACLVPLYRGPSISGAQFGNTTDTNVGPFVTGDYSETGASGGLQGNGSSKYLNTGFNVDQLPGAANCHLSSFITGTQDITSVRTLVGTIFNSVTDRYRLFLRTDSSTPPNYTLQVDLGKSEGVTQLNRTNTSGGLLVGSRTSTTNLSLYANGVSAGTNTNLTAETTGASPFFVFARNGPTEFYNGRMAAYSIGAGMTAAQVTAFNTAMQAFQTALTRNV